jgi:flagellar basal-body rod protein FlgG
MVIGFRTAASAMEAQGERLAVLANNLANVSTTGFKADHLEFYQSLSSPRAAGSLSPGPAAPSPAPVLARTRTDFSAGPLRETGNALDLALEGPGFFVIQTPGGLRLTRAGAFVRATDGTLATPDGAPVLGDGRQPLTLAGGGRVQVSSDGQVSVDGAAVGRLLVVDPRGTDRLAKAGASRFAPPPDMDLAPAPTAQVRQGALEQSNVNPVLTLVEMMTALRVYESAQRAARSSDETLARAINDVGRV